METLNLPAGDFELARVPPAGKRPLRAWDAADEYVLEYLSERDELGSLLVVGDSFGALSCALASYSPTVVNESAAGREAISANLERNGLAPIDAGSILDERSAETRYDAVVIKIPKATAHLVDILHRVRPHVDATTDIVGAAMAKHVHSSAIDAFEDIIGPTTTSLAKKKARLIHSTVDNTVNPTPNPWPKTWTTHGHRLSNYGGGFSPNKLDPGTALLLDSLPPFEELVVDLPASEPLNVVDLGCGNGIIGLAISALLDGLAIDHHICAVDDSALALAAARESWAVRASQPVSFHHQHRLVNIAEPGSVDLVVVNPPFHDDRALGDETAWSMFVDAHKVLRPGGRLIVVGNRHLAYHAKLKKIFGGIDQMASNAKFVVVQAMR